MKGERGGFRRVRGEQLFQELNHDSYKAGGKLPEPTRCPDCGAVFQKGRWKWGDSPTGAHEARCPACHRIRDRFPAGYVTMTGAFIRENRAELLQLVRNREGKEKAEHPLERIMAIEDTKEGMVVTTTASHLARNIAQSLHDAYKGELDFRYNKEDNLLRATWSR